MIPEFLIPDWQPPFTEQWATTYVQVLFEAFLFALGVPTAIYSLIVDDDIKRVGRTRVKLWGYFAFAALLFVAVSGFVWGPLRESVPSAGTPAPQPEAAAAAAAANDAKPKHVSAADLLLRSRSVLAASAVTVLPAFVLIAGLWLNRQFKRRLVVRRLARRLARSFRKRGHFDERILNDLSYLGEHGRAGDEKKLVLDEIDSLARDVQGNKWSLRQQYNGSELEELIRNIQRMLDNELKPGNDDNYRHAVEVLARVWRRLQSRTALPADATSTHETLKHLGLLAVRAKTEQTALAYLEEAAACDSDIVFEMGLSAFGDGKYFLGVAALTKLEGMASDTTLRNHTRDTAADIVSNMLGLVAHFAGEGSAAAFRRAETSLAVNQELFAPTLREAIAAAVEYQYGAGRYETADKLLLLDASAAKMVSVKLDLPLDAITPPLPPPHAPDAGEITSPHAAGEEAGERVPFKWGRSLAGWARGLFGGRG